MDLLTFDTTWKGVNDRMTHEDLMTLCEFLGILLRATSESLRARYQEEIKHPDYLSWDHPSCLFGEPSRPRKRAQTTSAVAKGLDQVALEVDILMSEMESLFSKRPEIKSWALRCPKALGDSDKDNRFLLEFYSLLFVRIKTDHGCWDLLPLDPRFVRAGVQMVRKVGGERAQRFNDLVGAFFLMPIQISKPP